MKITALALPLAVALASCGQTEDTYPNFAGTFSGTLTETYTCASNSPPAFPLSETLTITQLGSDVFVALSSCNGQSISGDAAGNAVSLTSGSQTNSPCQQTTPADAGADAIAISVSSLAGGTITLGSPGSIQVTLNQNATIDNNSNACSGVATGTLVAQ